MPPLLVETQKFLKYNYVLDNGARGQTRTGTEFNLRGILSPLRLPISPPGHFESLEAEAGIEPAYAALQAAA